MGTLSTTRCRSGGGGGVSQSCVEVLRDRGALGRDQRGVAGVGTDHLPSSCHAELEAGGGQGRRHAGCPRQACGEANK